MQKRLCLFVTLAALLVFSLPFSSSAEDVDVLIEFRSYALPLIISRLRVNNYSNGEFRLFVQRNPGIRFFFLDHFESHFLLQVARYHL
jgi:hypothetical protein